jgi:hypothetical protein
MTGSAAEYSDSRTLLATFINILSTLQTQIEQPQVDGRSLQQTFLTAQQLYQQQLLPTLMDDEAAASLMSYQTEINRALRLLGMDVTFLRSAKNSMTQQKRQGQMRQRLTTLLEFCGGLQNELTGDSAS